jgi:hypothetical protein
MAKMVRFFNVDLTAGIGVEILNIIGAIKFLHTGEIQQVTVHKVAAAGDPVLDIQIRYISNNSDLHKLAYLYESASVTDAGFVDSSIDAPFSCASKTVDGDLHLYLESDIDCELGIRIDFDINNYKGI